MKHPWTHYVAMGDSITEGFGMDPVDGIEPVPWAERLVRALRAGNPRLAYDNLAYRGLFAHEIVERQLERALALEPDLVSIAAGANDLLRPDFERDLVEADLEPLYSAFGATAATVFTFTYMNMPASGILPADGAEFLAQRMEALHDAIKVLAQRYGALVVDLWSAPDSANPAFWSADLQHANARGQAYAAGITIAALEAHAANLKRVA